MSPGATAITTVTGIMHPDRPAQVCTYRRHSIRASIGLLVASLVTTCAFAQDDDDVSRRPEFGIRLGTGQTDNVARDSTSEVRTDFDVFGLRFNARSDTQRVTGALFGDVELRQYPSNAVLRDDEEVIGSADGILSVHIVPERFTWHFQQNFGQTRTNLFAPVGPNNRERAAVSSTGPQLVLPAGRRNTLEMGGRVSDRTFEDSAQLDSRVTAAELRLARSVGVTTEVSISLAQSEYEYETDDQTYEFEVLFLTYAKELATGLVQLDLGGGEINIGSDSESTAVGRFQWDRDVGSRSRLGVWAGHELTDAGDLFRLGGVSGVRQNSLSGLENVLSLNDNRLRSIVLSRSPLQRSILGTQLAVAGALTTFAVSVAFSDDSFEREDTLDNSATTIQVSAGREFARSWRGEVNVVVQRQDFQDPPGDITRDNDDTLGGLAAIRQIGRRMSVSIAYERFRRDSVFDVRHENQYLVSLAYDF